MGNSVNVGGDGDFFSSGDGDFFSDDRLDSEGDRNPECMKEVDETGDTLPFGVFESEPIQGNTDFGDWFSCSESEQFGDEGIVGASTMEYSLFSWFTSFRG